MGTSPVTEEGKKQEREIACRTHRRGDKRVSTFLARPILAA